MATQSLGHLVTYLRGDSTSLNGAIAGSQARLAKFAKFAMWAGAAIGAAFAYKTVKSFIEFNDEMTQSLAIMGDVSKKTRMELSATARQLSTRSMFAASELAKGYYYLTSAGKNAAQSQVLLKDVARFAQAGQFDLAEATSLLTDAQNALGLSSRNVVKDQFEMIRVSDVLVGANTLADATTRQFAVALTTDAAASMRAFNIPLEEGVAVLAAYADRGIKGAHAGSMFGRFLRLLIPAAVKNAQAFKKLNIHVFNSRGNLRNLALVVGDMTRAFSTMSVKQKSVAMQQLGFMKRTQQVVYPLLGASQKLKDYEDKLDKMGGTSQRVADKQMKSLSKQTSLLGRNLKEASGELLNIQENLEGTAIKISKLNRWFRESWSGIDVTLKLMWYSIKRVMDNVYDIFYETWLVDIATVMGNAAHNIEYLFKWFGDNWNAVLVNAGGLAVGFGKTVWRAFKFSIQSWFRLFVDFFYDVGINFKNFAVAIKDALMMKGWNFRLTGQNLAEGMKINAKQASEILDPLAKAMNKANLTMFEAVPITTGLRTPAEKANAVNEALVREDLEFSGKIKKIQDKIDAQRKELMKPITIGKKGIGTPLPGEEDKVKPSAAKKYGAAVLKGSLEDYKAGLQRGTTEEKIETNTAKTNKIMESQVKVSKEIKAAIKAQAPITAKILKQGKF